MDESRLTLLFQHSAERGARCISLNLGGPPKDFVSMLKMGKEGSLLVIK